MQLPYINESKQPVSLCTKCHGKQDFVKCEGHCSHCHCKGLVPQQFTFFTHMPKFGQFIFHWWYIILLPQISCYLESISQFLSNESLVSRFKMANPSSYATRMSRLSARIFGELTRPTSNKSIKVIKIFSQKPVDLKPEVVQYYPDHVNIHRLMKNLRAYGLYRCVCSGYSNVIKIKRFSFPISPINWLLFGRFIHEIQMPDFPRFYIPCMLNIQIGTGESNKKGILPSCPVVGLEYFEVLSLTACQVGPI